MLRGRYAMSRTGFGLLAAIVLRICYAVCATALCIPGTELQHECPYAATVLPELSYGACGTKLGYRCTRSGESGDVFYAACYYARSLHCTRPLSPYVAPMPSQEMT